MPTLKRVKVIRESSLEINFGALGQKRSELWKEMILGILLGNMEDTIAALGR